MKIRPYHFILKILEVLRILLFELGRKLTVIGGQKWCWKI